ncbi:IST1-like protein [Chenopodium quinoa]|uniref:IST1-like protein n=1 Tax=Chenopodium quinoa TaxID=63459 RepID=A0A803MBC5_CHEQI|nr:IST1-like protein [Chenopodium quinoa]
MSVAYAVRTHCKKLAKLGAYFRRDFNSSKCKTWARMTTARIKLLRNKRETVVRQMRRDVALLLQSGQDATARIRVEHVIREQNMMAANEILELFCERLVTRLSIVAKQRDCPSDLKEAISSLIFAGPRCSDIPELLAIQDIFQKKYGKDFVDSATDLRPDSGVNRLLIEKLSALNPPGELKLKIMKEIAKEYQVQWDTTETETELLKPPEERIEGPRKFVSAGSLPLNSGRAPLSAEAQKPTTRLSSGGGNEMGIANYQDAASAAKAAADSAKDAVAAAQAAAQLAQTSYDVNTTSNQSPPPHHVNQEGNLGTQGREYRSFSLGGAANNCHSNTDMNSDDMDFNVVRWHSYNVRHTHTDIKFDESDCDEDIEMEQQPPSGMHGKPGTPSIHPKLPDYDALSARFEALKYRKT